MKITPGILVGVLLPLLAAAFAPAARADEPAEDRIRALEERIEKQERELRVLREKVAGQEGETDSLRAAVDDYLAKGADEGWFAEPGTLRAFWKHGLRFQSSDRAFELEIGGRINFDLAWFDADSAVEDRIGEFEDHSEFRRARILFAGRIYDRVEYKAEYDFANGDVKFADVWLGLTGLPVVGSFRVGNQKEPLSLEWQTSGKHTTFMERALPNALVPDRHVGFSVGNSALDGRLFWDLGVFANSSNGKGSTPENVSARVTGLPWISEDGNSLVLVGVSASRRDPAGNTDRYRERPEAHSADHRIVDTGDYGVDSETLLGLEAAFVSGPFSAQGEYLQLDNDADAVGDPTFCGWYVYVSWFLTGERRPYKGGAFGRVVPERRFLDGNGGPGAIEAAIRYSTLDLTDAGVDGGEVDDWTFGINWYLNGNTKVRLNYVWSDPTGPGSLGILMFRFEVDF